MMLFGFWVVRIKWILSECLICVVEISFFMNFGCFDFNLVNLFEIRNKCGIGLVVFFCLYSFWYWLMWLILCLLNNCCFFCNLVLMEVSVCMDCVLFKFVIVFSKCGIFLNKFVILLFL